MSEQPTLFSPEPATVEEYQFEPIKGYPMLNWRGKRPFTATRYYPAQLKERHGEAVDGWRNKIFWGDNLQVMSHLLKEYRGQVQLVYIDPPFDSKADYKQWISLHGKQVSNDHSAFEEKQYTDIWTNDEYLQFMYERLILLRELLAEEGSIYVHCDYRATAYIRLILDEIFGKELFLNENIWSYKSGGVSKDFFARKHDTIYLFGRSPDRRIFNTQYYRSYQAKKYNYNPNYPELWDEEKQQWYHNSVCRDVWDDIRIIGTERGQKERLDYPTQKPEALLERIIQASSNPGDIVFDCFMGSGTTQAVAMKLGRRFIGADINLGAIQITTKRLLGVAAELAQEPEPAQLSFDASPPQEEETEGVYYTGFEVYNVNHYDVFRNPVEARDLLLQALEVQRLEAGHLFDGEKDGRMIKLMPVNRIATRADLNELIAGFDYRAFERRHEQDPNHPVEKITLVCMGHEPDLAAVLKSEAAPYPLDVEVVDILRDRQDLQFKRDAEARIAVQDGALVIEAFYPMNLLQKLSLQQENVADWRELVESVMIDWNYDGAILEPVVVDLPGKDELVAGRYPIPAGAGTIRVKITDLLSESLEQEIAYG
ncbi:MAG: site-specific DNA-methyltransferase [Anaerolineae bacterium]|nr:site-specific DNA-methyltransferase [Anaerolineae bacterium]